MFRFLFVYGNTGLYLVVLKLRKQTEDHEKVHKLDESKETSSPYNPLED